VPTTTEKPLMRIGIARAISGTPLLTLVIVDRLRMFGIGLVGRQREFVA
jgi:hypothetical protein